MSIFRLILVHSAEEAVALKIGTSQVLKRTHCWVSKGPNLKTVNEELPSRFIRPFRDFVFGRS